MRPSHVAARENPHIPLTGTYTCLADALDEYGRVLQRGGQHPPSDAMLAQMATDPDERYAAIAAAPPAVLAGVLAGLSGKNVARYAPAILTSAVFRPAAARAVLLEAAADHVGAGRGGKRLAAAWLNLLESISDSPQWRTVHANQSGPAIAAVGTVYPDGLTEAAVERARRTTSVDDSSTLASAGRILDAAGLLDDAARDLLQLTTARRADIAATADVAALLTWCENPPPGMSPAHPQLMHRLRELILAGDAAGHDIPSYLTRVGRAVHQLENDAWDHVSYPVVWGVPGAAGSDGVLEAILGPADELNAWRRNLYCMLVRNTGVSLSPQAAARWLAGARPDDWLAAGIVGVGFDHEPLRAAAIAHTERCWNDPQRLGFGVSYTLESSEVADWLAAYELPTQFGAWLLTHNRPAAHKWLSEGLGGATPPTRELVETMHEMFRRSPVHTVSPLDWHTLVAPLRGVVENVSVAPAVAAWLPGSMSVFGHHTTTGVAYDRYRTEFAAMLADAAGDDLAAWQQIDAVGPNPAGPSVADTVDRARLVAHQNA